MVGAQLDQEGFYKLGIPLPITIQLHVLTGFTFSFKPKTSHPIWNRFLLLLPVIFHKSTR